MSATGRGRKRSAADYYPTPDPLALRIVEWCTTIRPGGRILEPSAGSGAFVRACQAIHPHAPIVAVEPSPCGALAKGRGLKLCRESLEAFTRRTQRHAPDLFDLIVGNPPFLLAAEHLRICLELLAPGGELVFLLRLGFLGSAARAALFEEHPPACVTILSERPSFCWAYSCRRRSCRRKWTTAPGIPRTVCPRCKGSKVTRSTTDAAEYAVFRWNRSTRPGETRTVWL